MRSSVACVSALGFALSSCGAHKLALPADPIGKAATCAVVAAADARSTTQVTAPLTIDAQGEIVHYALLAGAAEGHFSQDKAAAVMQQMQQIKDKIIDGKWQALVGPCKAAFPEADPQRPISLPKDTLESEMGCYTLGKFMVKALSTQGPAYEEQLLKYGELNRKLDPKVAVVLDRRGVRSDDARKAEQDSALAKVVKLGTPTKVMDACSARYA